MFSFSVSSGSLFYMDLGLKEFFIFILLSCCIASSLFQYIMTV